MTKVCIKCNEDKELGEFRCNPKIGNVCKVCFNKQQALRRKPRGKNPLLIRRRGRQRFVNRNEGKFFRSYGIRYVDSFALFKIQKGKCAICGCYNTDARNGGHKHLALDHCHATGKVRGLLCMSCNMSLGFLDDNIDYLSKGISYLKEHS